jgi:hypothetical protein
MFVFRKNARATLMITPASTASRNVMNSAAGSKSLADIVRASLNP